MAASSVLPFPGTLYIILSYYGNWAGINRKSFSLVDCPEYLAGVSGDTVTGESIKTNASPNAMESA